MRDGTRQSRLRQQRRPQPIRLALTAACGLLLGIGGAAQAATLYTTTFPEATNTLPANWDIATGEIVGPGGWYVDAGGDFRFDGSGNGLAFLDGATVLSNGSTASSLTNTIVTSVMRKSGSYVGLATHLSDENTFYQARIEGGNGLAIYRNGVSPQQLGSTTQLSENYITGEKWTLVMTTLGGTNAQQIGVLAYDQNGQLVGKNRFTSNGALLTSGSVGTRAVAAGVYSNLTISTPTQITTADGNGADTYVEFRSDQPANVNTNYGSASAVIVKSGEDASPARQLYRKAYLRYDLSSITKQQDVFSASLDIKDNVVGGTSVTFNVYGLLDGSAGDAAGGWNESTITWNNAPDNAAGTGLGPDAVLLGTFTGGTDNEVLRFTSDALVNFLNHDTNGLATFVITMPTAGSFTSGSYLQFDSKEQSGGVAPALSLVTITVPAPAALPAGISLLGLLGLGRRTRRLK